MINERNWRKAAKARDLPGVTVGVAVSCLGMFLAPTSDADRPPLPPVKVLRANRGPAVFADITALVGREAATRLVQAKGGTRIFIPSRVSKEHWLAKLLGHEIAQTLAKHYADQLSASGHRGGRQLELPRAHALVAKLTWDQALGINLSLRTAKSPSAAAGS
jgi:hypothetical protein